MAKVVITPDQAPRRTPLVSLQRDDGQTIWIKNETQQHSGAFKFRGSFNFLSQADVPTGCVAAASTGNHAGGLSMAARLFGYEARIFVPVSTPAGKQQRIRDAGGQITLIEGDYETALAAVTDFCAQTGATLVPSYDHDLVIEGNRNVFREITDALGKDPETLYVPVGGGGILSGALRALPGPQTQVVGVEYDKVARVGPIVAGDLHEIPPLAAPLPASTEGIGIRTIGDIPRTQIIQAQNFTLQNVSADEMAAACRLLHVQCGITAELAACASVAACLRAPLGGDGPVVCVVTGGNIDADTHAAIIGS